jgi:phage tail-like protein
MSSSIEPAWPLKVGETITESSGTSWSTEDYIVITTTHTREKIFNLLPQTWKNQDESGILERFLGIWDTAFDACDQKIAKLLETRNVEAVPDRFLVLLGNLLGHSWRSYKTYQWNRERIQELITRYSYKGTSQSIYDLVKEHGGLYSQITDNASLVDVWNIQGGMFFDSDFFHPGVYQLTVTDDIDMSNFMDDFNALVAAGNRWDIVVIPVDVLVISETVTYGHPAITPHLYQTDRTDLWWNFCPELSVSPIIFVEIEDVIVPLGCSFLMSSLTFEWDDDSLEFGLPYVPANYNYMQPLVDINVLT